ncbi:pyridoxamine 5'-phosphate oxidase [Fulvimarina sp. 2208YS6-2-32]|uniref:Pyridoxine/pyridoxamine 5'-phosphate oxidase n=1 Tax=Fulvimarina uroteuthidis TaxID=3098149 RepID=A0ABU5I2Y8_9HYPH|nr:pyridoxamine 5'-phosphate oxidase [Fulvimarina sp. 2208YS6-2-32]MDY8108546.1 pyridoxamine 5'-phosphate oxidase [Fulvimarina sp. 2208YS6-2-32]
MKPQRNGDVRLGDEPVGDDPFALFATWFEAAEANEPNDANALSLATVFPDGQPDVRIVLLKDFDARGFVFYTNFEGSKGRQILASMRAAMAFHWKSSLRQVRIRGPIEIVSDEEADAYYQSRPRGSRIGAWASEQSKPLESRAMLEKRVAELAEQYEGEEIPRPPHWSGFRLVPMAIEFWQNGPFRLHDRALYERADRDAPWVITRLYP